MRSITVRLLLIIFIEFALSRSTKFVQESLVVAYARNYSLLETPVIVFTTVHCAVLCANSPFCSMFVHSNTLKQCALYGLTNRTTSTFKLIDSNDWKSYVYKIDCPYMYARAVGKCWKIISGSDKMTTGRTKCQNLKGDLIQISDIQVFDFFSTFLNSTSTWSSDQYWIGATKSSTGFTWIDSKKIVDSRIWGQSQPDGFGSSHEDCVDVIPIFNFYLNDAACEGTFSSFCEIPMSSEI